jgi:hypothetical protein
LIIREMQNKLAIWSSEGEERKFDRLLRLIANRSWLQEAARVTLASNGAKTPGIDGACKQARKYRTSVKSLIKRWARRPIEGNAKTWQLYGRSGKGNLCGVALRRLVTSRKMHFRWRNPESNPYILREEERNTVTSRYYDIAMAMSHT